MSEDQFNYNHQSSKEDDDPILEFKSIDTDHLLYTQVKLGNVKFYPATSQELVALSMQRIEEIRKKDSKAGIQHVIPLDPYRFSWLNRSKKYGYLAEEAFINLPAGAGILWMAKKLGHPLPEMIPTISYVMNLIRLAQAKEYTIFIVGSHDKVLEKLSHNLKRSFPRLRIVGRHNGFFNEVTRTRVVEALRKTNPHIILLGLGYHNEMKWLKENKESLGNAILVNVGGSLDILAGKTRKAPDFFQVRGLTWLWRAMNRPQRWHRMFTIKLWFLKVWYWRFFKK